MRSLWDGWIVLRDHARITACTALARGGGVAGAFITLAGDALISHCSTLLLNTGEGGGIWGENLIEMRNRAQVVECQVQFLGGCISAPDILIADLAHVGHCTALNSKGSGFGGCLAASSSIVMSDFAMVTHCYGDSGGAFDLLSVDQMGATILLSGNALVSDCVSAWGSAVVSAGGNNTMIVLQDDTTIQRAYSLWATFSLFDGASLRMTGRASIIECVGQSYSAFSVFHASLALLGQNKIVNCRGTA